MTTLSLDDATFITEAALKHAGGLGTHVTVTVVDGGGNVRTQTRMDGARFGTLNVSANKAFTAAAFGAPTKVLTDLVQPGAPLFGFADAMGGRFVSFAGGIPLVRNDEVIGAIGISGGSVDQDQAIADAELLPSRRPDSVVKAVRLHAFGELPVIDEVPEPTVSGPLDVVVRVGGAGLCRTDLHVLDGAFADLCLPPPFVMGHETAGWVHEVGQGVEGLAVGDPVIVHPYLTCGVCPPCRRGDDQLCERFRFSGAMIDGGFADFIATNARSLVKLSSTASPADVAGLADGGLAAYRAVKGSLAWLPPGSVAAVIGAGGLGHIAVQLVRTLSTARVIAVDRSPTALQLAAELGADLLVHADGGHVQAVRDATDGRGADVVFDFVGDGGTPAEGLAMIARGGRYVVVGYGGRLEVPTYDLVANEITIAGSLVGSHTDLVELASLSDSGRVVVITQRYELRAIREAMEDLRAGRIRGRAVLVP